MKHLHEQCITHGNFKSSNVLINPIESLEMAKATYLHVKLADFGLSKTMAMSANFSS
jgi:serine/threonine protein kinase